ncbi:hypothetical protein THASP1DRAFT_33692 [Thamnocephalis sphaerospora]|uniref:Root hair defective 3 GTP-binding protein-domain-containing protein n=1 Tax=Thamnocephalis sphaerospora TaxID=78915 RepID=A0A4P9XFY8_9FUNG|nr:hypothetical protein THASP1DRAFT_33692 [Thamnocephalis sphaerospora]|eukprot:RKP04533.1 hypothetical protein THASP1DRAFT_33692 [Thamnocephalis sphaerospora]
MDYDIVTLPSKADASNEFDAAVNKLRERFINKNSPDYLFKPSYWKLVSSDKIASHLTSMQYAIQTHWSVIGHEAFDWSKTPPKFDAKGRYAIEKTCCFFKGQYTTHIDGFYNMVIQHVYNKFLEAIKPVQDDIYTKGVEDEYLKKLVKCRRTTMASFNAIVEHHQGDIYEAKRDKLRSKCNEKIKSLASEQTPWNATGLAIQLFADRTLQMQEKAIQERVQLEVERRIKEMELAAAQTKVELDAQRAKIHHLEAVIANNDAEISNYASMIGMLEVANSEKYEFIAALKATNSEKDETISALKAENNAKGKVIGELEAVNTVKDAIISALKAENGDKNRDVSILEAANSKKDEAISVLEIEAGAMDSLIDAHEKDAGELKAVISRQDTAINELLTIIRRQEIAISKHQATTGSQGTEMKA